MGEENGDDGHGLFRELQRYFPLAKVEDYCRGGMWLMDLLHMDTELVQAHRRESGAPEPPPAEEIELLPSRAAYGGRALPAATPAAASKPAALSATPTKAGVPTSAAAGAVADLRMIAAFVQQFGLEPTRTKLMLARLTPVRRKAVIDNFEFESTNGITSPTLALEKYIKENESPGGAVPGSRPGLATPTSAYPTAAGKRPLDAAAAADAKRPKFGGAAAGGPSARGRPIFSQGGRLLGAKPGDLIKNLLGDIL